MPKPPSERRPLPEVLDDLESIQRHNPDHADRILLTSNDWQEKIAGGCVPQDHLTPISGSADDRFYRERIRNSGYRIIDAHRPCDAEPRLTPAVVSVRDRRRTPKTVTAPLNNEQYTVVTTVKENIFTGATP